MSNSRELVWRCNLAARFHIIVEFAQRILNMSENLFSFTTFYSRPKVFFTHTLSLSEKGGKRGVLYMPLNQFLKLSIYHFLAKCSASVLEKARIAWRNIRKAGGIKIYRGGNLACL